MRILVIGSSGNFGSTLVAFLRGNGHEVTGIDRDDEIPGLLKDYEACFLAIPLNGIMEYISRNEHPMLVEISSVKTPMKKYSNRVVSIHPLFGPSSIGNPEFRNILFINDISQPQSLKSIEFLFPGFAITSLTADEHDRLMVELLVRPYILSILSSRTSSGTTRNVTCTSHRKLLDLSSISMAESREVLLDTIRHNPYSKEALKNLRDEMDGLFNEF